MNNVKNKTIKITPYLLVVSLIITWVLMQKNSSVESVNTGNNRVKEHKLSAGELALKEWLEQHKWSYFLQVNDTQCSVLVSRPKAQTYTQISTNTDQACKALLIDLKSQ
jgi:regulatory protein YycI of two-component signal transduction system YycFG